MEKEGENIDDAIESSVKHKTTSKPLNCIAPF